MKIVISGASGFVGSFLVPHLRRVGFDVTRLVRHAPDVSAGERQWDPTSGELDPDVVSGAGAVINLNGRNISAGRWTSSIKDDLRSSRLDATQTVVRAIARADRPPALLINASATGYYGDRGDEELDESSPPGGGFLADLCREWEAAALEAASGDTRVALLRLGMILGDGGALEKMLTPFKLGLGGPMGTGRQWWPWVSMTDVIGVVDHLLARDDLSGPVNLVAPQSVTSAGFARALGEALGRPAVIPAPAFAVKLALGEMAEALLLASTRARPAALEANGFQFAAPTLTDAFRTILG